jgi:hypothetical protein
LFFKSTQEQAAVKANTLQVQKARKLMATQSSSSDAAVAESTPIKRNPNPHRKARDKSPLVSPIQEEEGSGSDISMDDELLAPDDKPYDPKNDNFEGDSRSEDEVEGTAKNKDNRQVGKQKKPAESVKSRVRANEDGEHSDVEEAAVDDDEYEVGEKLFDNIDVDETGLQSNGECLRIILKIYLQNR